MEARLEIKSIDDLKAGEEFYTSYGEKLIAKEVGMLEYPALLIECTPVEAVTVQGRVKDRFFIIKLAGLFKLINTDANGSKDKS